jgi:O-antigen ligase
MATGSSRVHNLYLKLLYEAGLPGLTGLFIVVATAFRQSWRLVVNTRGTDLYLTAVALLGSLVSVNVFALFQPLFVQRYYWLPVALIGVLWALRRQEASEEAATESSLPAARPRRMPPPPEWVASDHAR